MRSPNFIPATNETLDYHGQWDLASLPDTLLTRGHIGDSVQIRGVFRELYGVFHQHEWSGIIAVETQAADAARSQASRIDLFTPYPYDQRLLLYGADTESEVLVQISATGTKNPLSFGTEMVLRGFDLVMNAPPASAAAAPPSAQDFAQMQSGHVDRWRALQNEAHYAEIELDRNRRYLQRYRRASAFFGHRLLDIGCGYIFPEIMELLVSLGIEYHGLDIDERVVAYGNNQIREHHVAGSVQLGEVGVSSLENEAFDTVFSSHTLEHSSDLQHSLSEVFRAIKPSGHLIMAVPLGWDDSEEHVHCYDSATWLLLVQRAGFEVLSFEIAKLYDPGRYDITIVARKPPTS